MENSKNATSKLYAKGPLFFNLGLVISISLCFIAFEYKVYIGEEETVKLPDDIDVVLIMDDVKPTVQPPKPKPFIPEKKNTIAKIVDEKEETLKPKDKSKDLNIDALNELMTNDAPTEERVDDMHVYDGFLEDMPAYDGGMEAFYKFLANEIRYPNKEQRMGIDGRVFLSFIIEKDGSLSDIKVIKGVSEGLDKEAIRVLKNSPAWNPGKQRGNPVRVQMRIPIYFQLN